VRLTALFRAAVKLWSARRRLVDLPAAASASEAKALIEIVTVPPGDAPIAVRTKWVGLILPLTPGEERPIAAPYRGVLPGSRSLGERAKELLLGGIRVGYAVKARAAFDALERCSPEAYSWWRENTPRLLAADGRLLFALEACRVVSWPRSSGVPEQQAVVGGTPPR
jgi:hypothetical protein